MQQHSNPPTLKEVQNWLRWIVTDSRGVKTALENPNSNDLQNDRYHNPNKTVQSFIESASDADLRIRLDIYAEGYFIRLHDSLKSDFILTAKILGELSFKKLVADYLKVYPSQSTNITEAGKYLPKFIESYTDLMTYSFLPSLVDLEWKIVESFFAENTEIINPEIFSEITEDQWSRMRFKFAPFIKVLNSKYPLDLFFNLRNATTDDLLTSADFNPSDIEQAFLLTRISGNVILLKQSELEHALLLQLQAGAGLFESMEMLQEKYPDRDISAEIMTCFNKWISTGSICELNF